ncbi:MAG: hypothetical protein LBB58_02315 [Cellulomonadaceae bacterium]|jgi:hypothetical protein|nr:hypothetical protein [Cellulomonadaceae bacterium]
MATIEHNSEEAMEFINAYAAKVRSHLSDLDPSVANDISAGLESDLGESLSERGPDIVDPAQVFGSPAHYANELRTSAGLPALIAVEPGGPGKSDKSSTVTSRIRQNRRARWLWAIIPAILIATYALLWPFTWALGGGNELLTFGIPIMLGIVGIIAACRWAVKGASKYGATEGAPGESKVRGNWDAAWSPITSTPSWARLRELGTELQAVWWVLRGWIIGAFLGLLFGGRGGLLPSNLATFLLILLLIAVSVQWGRGQWRHWGWVATAAKAMSAIALILVVPLYALNAANSRDWRSQSGNQWQAGWNAGYGAGLNDGSSATTSDEGLWQDGNQIRNIFAFDADGEPIPAVQLFDQNGLPIFTQRFLPDSRSISDSHPWSVNQDPSWFGWARRNTAGQPVWNAYPLLRVNTGNATDWQLLPGYFDNDGCAGVWANPTGEDEVCGMVWGDWLLDDNGQLSLRPDHGPLLTPAWPFLRAAGVLSMDDTDITDTDTPNTNTAGDDPTAPGGTPEVSPIDSPTPTPPDSPTVTGTPTPLGTATPSPTGTDAPADAPAEVAPDDDAEVSE